MPTAITGEEWGSRTVIGTMVALNRLTGPSITRYVKLETIKVLVGVVLSAIALVFTLRDVDAFTTMQVTIHADYPLAILSLLTVALTVTAKALRWRVLLGTRYELPFAKALSFLTIGQMVNTVFPLRFGELERTYLAVEK